MASWSGRSSVARQFFVLQLALVLLVVAVGSVLVVIDARANQREQSRKQTVDVAQAVADSPAVVSALATRDPSATIQPYAEEVRRDTGTDFVVVLGLDRTRYSHPDPGQIGGTFLGDLGDAPQGKVFTQEFAGTLGPSMRAVVPVTEDGEVIALVSVGITMERIGEQVRQQLLLVAAIALALLVAGAVGSWLVSRRLLRQTHGMGEQEITRMYEYYDAVLHAVREGLLVLDREGRVQLANDEAVRLLGLPEDRRDGDLSALGLPEPVAASLATGEAGSDEIHLVGDRVLVVNQAPATWQGRDLGSVATFRDRTELQEVMGELDAVRGLADSLRAQTHESANRLHTMVSLIELGRAEEAVEFAVGRLHGAQALADRVGGVGDEPVVAALLLGKSAQADERGIDLVLDPECSVAGLPLSHAELVTIVGNLLDNAFEAVAEAEARTVTVRLVATPASFVVDVEDSGPGLAPESADRVFERGWSTKPGEEGVGRGLGLALVAQTVRRHGGTVTAARSSLGGARFQVRIGA